VRAGARLAEPKAPRLRPTFLRLIAGALALAAAASAEAQTGRPVEHFNFVLGTQTFGPSYHFTAAAPVVETAGAIAALGSNTIKFQLKPAADGEQTLAEIARSDPAIKTVIDMPFANLLMWVYPPTARARLFDPATLGAEYSELYDLTRYLWQAYSGTGKVSFSAIGRWTITSPPAARKTPRPSCWQMSQRGSSAGNRRCAWARRTLLEAVVAARRSANLSRYVPSGLLPLLAEADVEVLKHGRRQHAAILFADIRGFTALSGGLDPEAIVEFLASFRCRAMRALEAHGGIVDKFVGDDVMGVFGVPIATPGDAANAPAAGRALQAEIAAWNKKRRCAGAGRFLSESASTMAKCKARPCTIEISDMGTPAHARL
jgi:hypothetical protein